MTTEKRFLETLIIDLSEDSLRLDKSLRRIQYLSAVTGHHALYHYLDLEINGYTDNSILPEYRKKYADLKLTVLNDYKRVEKIILDCPVLKEKIKRQKGKILVCDAVGELESREWKLPLQMENYTLPFARDISDFVYNTYVTHSNYDILGMYFTCGEKSISDLVACIRHLFLSLAFKLSEEFGTASDLSDIVSSPNRVNTVINTYFSELAEL